MLKLKQLGPVSEGLIVDDAPLVHLPVVDEDEPVQPDVADQLQDEEGQASHDGDLWYCSIHPDPFV